MNFLTLKEGYTNELSYNDDLHTSFTSKVKEIDWLFKHRQNVEEHALGYGDQAFHYMWYVILNHLKTLETSQKMNLLEIGVFKGQVISLWGLISKQIGLNVNIHAISPFKGNPQPKNKLIYKILLRISQKFKNSHSSANFYEDEDYLQIVQKHFQTHHLDFNEIIPHIGFSTDPQILASLQNTSFSLIYVDGDHTYDGVIADIKNFSPLLAKDGLLVMDDASNNIPGSIFWKGHQQVSDACEIIPELGFKNIFNIGHNRVYQKL